MDRFGNMREDERNWGTENNFFFFACNVLILSFFFFFFILLPQLALAIPSTGRSIGPSRVLLVPGFHESGKTQDKNGDLSDARYIWRSIKPSHQCNLNVLNLCSGLSFFKKKISKIFLIWNLKNFRVTAGSKM